MAKEGLKSVESALSSGGGDDKDLGFGKILNDPNLYTKLKNNPKTSEFMNDPQFVAKLERLKTNPQLGNPDMFSDPRLLTAFAALMGIDMDLPNMGFTAQTNHNPMHQNQNWNQNQNQNLNQNQKQNKRKRINLSQR